MVNPFLEVLPDMARPKIIKNNLGNKLTYQLRNTIWQLVQQNEGMHIYNWIKTMSYFVFITLLITVFLIWEKYTSCGRVHAKKI